MDTSNASFMDSDDDNPNPEKEESLPNKAGETMVISKRTIVVPMIEFTAAHSCKGRECSATIMCADLERACFDALFISKAKFARLESDEAVDAFMEFHKMHQAEHTFNIDELQVCGVAITRPRKCLCVPMQMYRLYDYFTRLDQRQVISHTQKSSIKKMQF